MNLQIKGADFLSEVEKQDFDLIVGKYSEKIKHLINNEFSLRIFIKEHNKHRENKNKRKRYSIEIEISGEIPKIVANSEDWDLNSSLREGFEAILNEIEHKFHIRGK
jgi:hypothetical protein